MWTRDRTCELAGTAEELSLILSLKTEDVLAAISELELKNICIVAHASSPSPRFWQRENSGGNSVDLQEEFVLISRRLKKEKKIREYDKMWWRTKILRDRIEKNSRASSSPDSYVRREKREEVKKNIVELGANQNHCPTEEIISYLNQKTGKNFSPKSAETIRCIKARWTQFPNIDFFKKVVDIKTDKWKSDPAMSDYLRPSTLFGTKFESYLNEKQTQAVGRWTH